jgi:HlyD family secretion protein
VQGGKGLMSNIKMPKVNRVWLTGAGAVAVLAVGGSVLLAQGAGGATAGDYTFETAEVERGDVARVVTASGAVQPLNQVEVGSEVSGRIQELFVDFNSPVRKDQVLAQIDPQSFLAAAEQARARMLQSQASVATARAAIESARLTYTQSERDYNRQKLLHQEGAISQAAWEQTEQAFELARLKVRDAETALQSAEAGLAQARASLQDAQFKLDRTKIRSPIDGVVIAREVNVGQTVQSSMNVAKFFTIAQDLSQIQIEAAVVESDIGGVDTGDPATFTVDAFPGQTFRGAVTQVRKLGAEQANVVTYTVVVSAQNPNGQLLPGMTANVEITADRASDVLRIAYDATRFNPPKELQDDIGGEAPNAPGGPRGPGGPGGGGPGGPGGGRFMAGGGPAGEILKEMGLEQPRIERITADMQKEMEAIRASLPAPPQGGGQPFGGGGFGPGGGPPRSIQQQQAMGEMRQRFQAAQETVLRRHMSPEEIEEFNRLRGAQASQKREDVFVVGAGGKLERKTLILGLSDGSFAEVIRGAQEGDAFVVRATPAKPAKT